MHFSRFETWLCTKFRIRAQVHKYLKGLITHSTLGHSNSHIKKDFFIRWIFIENTLKERKTVAELLRLKKRLTKKFVHFIIFRLHNLCLFKTINSLIKSSGLHQSAAKIHITIKIIRSFFKRKHKGADGILILITIISCHTHSQSTFSNIYIRMSGGNIVKSFINIPYFFPVFFT